MLLTGHARVPWRLDKLQACRSCAPELLLLLLLLLGVVLCTGRRQQHSARTLAPFGSVYTAHTHTKWSSPRFQTRRRGPSSLFVLWPLLAGRSIHRDGRFWARVASRSSNSSRSRSSPNGSCFVLPLVQWRRSQTRGFLRDARDVMRADAFSGCYGEAFLGSRFSPPTLNLHPR
uniref:Putative secreted peptide n=1 Tax=Anopheles braziliensis TaxID=58242 RepID=A0A2M3ZRG5_9DIPT